MGAGLSTTLPGGLGRVGVYGPDRHLVADLGHVSSLTFVKLPVAVVEERRVAPIPAGGHLILLPNQHMPDPPGVSFRGAHAPALALYGPEGSDAVAYTVVPLTAEEFEAGYAARSKRTVEELRAIGRVVKPCECGDDGCQGWQSTTEARWAEEQGHGSSD